MVYPCIIILHFNHCEPTTCACRLTIQIASDTAEKKQAKYYIKDTIPFSTQIDHETANSANAVDSSAV